LKLYYRLIKLECRNNEAVDGRRNSRNKFDVADDAFQKLSFFARQDEVLLYVDWIARAH